MAKERGGKDRNTPKNGNKKSDTESTRSPALHDPSTLRGDAAIDVSLGDKYQLVSSSPVCNIGTLIMRTG